MGEDSGSFYLKAEDTVINLKRQTDPQIQAMFYHDDRNIGKNI